MTCADETSLRTPRHRPAPGPCLHSEENGPVQGRRTPNGRNQGGSRPSIESPPPTRLTQPPPKPLRQQTLIPARQRPAATLTQPIFTHQRPHTVNSNNRPPPPSSHQRPPSPPKSTTQPPHQPTTMPHATPTTNKANLNRHPTATITHQILNRQRALHANQPHQANPPLSGLTTNQPNAQQTTELPPTPPPNIDTQPTTTESATGQHTATPQNSKNTDHTATNRHPTANTTHTNLPTTTTATNTNHTSHPTATQPMDTTPYSPNPLPTTTSDCGAALSTGR